MKNVYKNCRGLLMEKQKIDRFIDAFRSAMYHEFQVDEEGMVANAPGAQGGFGGGSPAAGPTAGFDPVMAPKKEKEFKLDGRNKYVKKYVNQLMKGREKRKQNKLKKSALNYNPYFK